MNQPKLNLPDLPAGYVDKTDAKSLRLSFAERMLYSLAKDKHTATHLDCYLSLAYAIRQRLTKRWVRTQQEYYYNDSKRVYYMSMEFMLGRALGNNLINLGLYEEARKAMLEVGVPLDEIEEMEWDAGLGNGGLGRLAACFLDSMATLKLPAWGYGIRYEYGIFFQHLFDGFQIEAPDNWLRYGNPWEIGQPELLYPVKFHGEVHQYVDHNGRLHCDWINTDYVMAMAYDYPIPGYGCNNVNALRLWSAKSTRDFNLEYFNSGDYIRAVEEKNASEVISKVLYPRDDTVQGRELRLKQEYFFVSATLQDILRRFEKTHDDYEKLSDKIAVQLNDTHPALAVADLMRIMVDEKNVPWDHAWDITKRVFAYTNHTIMPEALETWRVDLFERLLPRHLQIIYEINRRFLDNVWAAHPGDVERLKRMSIIAESPEKTVQMAKLALIGSHSVNGVSALHSEIIKNDLFADFYQMSPEKFNNKTNGITQRRWLKLCNPRLSALIDEAIGDKWTTDLDQLKKLAPLAEDAAFREKWNRVKQLNKEDLAAWAKKYRGVTIDPDSMFDFQVKRIHEYKRQLLNLLHVIECYRNLRENPGADFVPRTVFFGGKAAPGYFMAKLILKLITSVAHIIHRDPLAKGKLKVVFLVNYCVSLAQQIFPASELSEQISTAGTEASGTGNMKFALNGALTIGTLDGANVEMHEEVGPDNIFIFGLTTPEVKAFRERGYSPAEYIQTIPQLEKTLEMIRTGVFCPTNLDLFVPIVESLLTRDEYLVAPDYLSYADCQKQVDAAYLDRNRWNRMSILNVANMGKFSTDRTIREYAEDIWGVKPVEVSLEEKS
jgi:glycogen phosphorylase